ncbi:MAG: uracil-DNA glycosylase [Arcobacteraceae bacterium]|nr:uracil-DNA glycosylase [Arcobacteraceae bacterium]
MTWQEIIKNEQQKDYYKLLELELNKQYETTTVFPPKDKIFTAFDLTPIDNLKVVILGQDPYHKAGQAQGLAFSTPKNIKNPPSMQNILKEINNEYKDGSKCNDGDLTPWAKQGVLLINAILTVQEANPKSHEKLGWQIFTDNIIKYISLHCKDIVFILWGAPAIKKQKIIDTNKHHILTAVHPSPLSAYRGFFGCNHFIKTNEILKKLGKEPIIW